MTASPRIAEASRSGGLLAFWMIVTVLFQAAAWVSGARGAAIGGAIEMGAGKVESRGIGEVGDDAIRKAIGLQRETSTFWTVLTLFGDFVVEPLALPLRAGLVSALFAGVALLRGRPGAFAGAIAGCAWAQGFWVLGTAIRAGLAIGLRRPEIETSPTLLLPPGTHPGLAWAALRQLDVFALLGWFALFRCGVTRARVGWLASAAIVLFLFALEAAMRMECTVVIEAGMRLTLLPERY